MYRTEMLHSVQHDSVCHSERSEESNFYLYPLSLLSYLFALFSKEMAITLPLLIFFFDYLIGSCRTFTNRISRFYLGYILVTIFYLLVRFRWFHNPVESGVSYPQENLWFNFLAMLKVLASYLKLLFFPVNLNADYIVPVASSPWNMSCILSLLLIISIAVIGYRLFFHSKLLFFSLLKIIAREPNSYKAHSSLGILLIKRGQEEEGISELRTSLSINPSYPDAHNNMGTLYEQKGMYDDATKEYRCALRLDQNLSEAHYNLGNTYLKTSNYDKAVAEYRLYISIRGDHPTVLYNLGVAYMKQGMLGESAAAFQKSLQGNPGNADVHNNLGVLFTRKGQFSNAIREFKEALKYNPAHPDALSNLEAVSELP